MNKHNLENSCGKYLATSTSLPSIAFELPFSNPYLHHLLLAQFLTSQHCQINASLAALCTRNVYWLNLLVTKLLISDFGFGRGWEWERVRRISPILVNFCIIFGQKMPEYYTKNADRRCSSKYQIPNFFRFSSK